VVFHIWRGRQSRCKFASMKRLISDARVWYMLMGIVLVTGIVVGMKTINLFSVITGSIALTYASVMMINRYCHR